MTASSFSEIELALTAVALEGDAGGLYRIASDLMDKGVPFDSVLFDYLIPTERSVGMRWERGDYLVAEEHAVTAAIETVISLLTGMFDQPTDAAMVVVATAEGDDHSLPARAVSAHLLYLGYRTKFLGASIPADDLRDFLEEDPPVALVLSGAMTTHLLGARAVIEAAHSLAVPVVVGGKAFGAEGQWAPTVGADAWVGSLGEVPAVIEEWVANPPSIKQQEPLPDTLSALVTQRQRVLANADAELADNFDGNVPTRVRDEVALLLSSVEGALVTGDDRVTVEMIEWQASSLTAHGYTGSLVVDALLGALEGVSPEAASLLERARQTASAD